MADDEWGNELMRQIAAERFEKDHTLHVVEVHEHAGWYLSFNRDGEIVGTANDAAVISEPTRRWIRSFDDFQIVGCSLRGQDDDLRYPGYYPAIAAEVAA